MSSGSALPSVERESLEGDVAFRQSSPGGKGVGRRARARAERKKDLAASYPQLTAAAALRRSGQVVLEEPLRKRNGNGRVSRAPADSRGRGRLPAYGRGPIRDGVGFAVLSATGARGPEPVSPKASAS